MAREFDQLFDEWASTYDETVTGNDVEYREVFLNYDKILETVSIKVKGQVLEFGVGTGNLTKQFLKHGHSVIGIEPSKEMRAIATRKLPAVKIHDGDFLIFPTVNEQIQSIASSYAFHHLTDSEKKKAIGLYANMLGTGGKIVFADTMFTNEKAKQNIIDQAQKQQYFRLVKDLQTEYYPTISYMQQIFTEAGFDTSFKQMNKFVWVLEANKK